jgi:hypothetical protein
LLESVGCQDGDFSSFQFVILSIHRLLLKALVGVQFQSPACVNTRKVSIRDAKVGSALSGMLASSKEPEERGLAGWRANCVDYRKMQQLLDVTPARREFFFCGRLQRCKVARSRKAARL